MTSGRMDFNLDSGAIDFSKLAKQYGPLLDTAYKIEERGNSVVLLPALTEPLLSKEQIQQVQDLLNSGKAAIYDNGDLFLDQVLKDAFKGKEIRVLEKIEELTDAEWEKLGVKPKAERSANRANQVAPKIIKQSNIKVLDEKKKAEIQGALDHLQSQIELELANKNKAMPAQKTDEKEQEKKEARSSDARQAGERSAQAEKLVQDNIAKQGDRQAQRQRDAAQQRKSDQASAEKAHQAERNKEKREKEALERHRRIEQKEERFEERTEETRDEERDVR